MILTLLSGNQIDSQNVNLDRRTYHVFVQGSDITDDLTHAQKLSLFSDFDVEKENNRIHNERGSGTKYTLEPLETNTGKIFIDQITTDPLEAPLETLSNTVNKIVGNSGVKKIALIAVVGIVLYLVLRKKTP